jgi:hypothetical protein
MKKRAKRAAHAAVRFGVVFLCCPLSAVLFFAQTTTPRVVYTQFSPLVVRSDRAAPILFLVKTAGAPTRVALEVGGAEVEMHDDGTGGDQTPADGLYTLTLQASQVVQGLLTDDVFRPFIGYLNVYQQQTRVLRSNVFAEVITGEIARTPVTRLASDVQATAYLVNVVDSDFVTGVTSDLTRITRKLYQHVFDDFDFVNVVYAANRVQNRFHFGVKNDVSGIGVSALNNSSLYGSAGSLLGISVFPVSNFFDGAEHGYQHELAHQWINFLRIPALESGIPHWPLSSLASGIMGFSIPPTNEGGNYACLLQPESGGIRLVPRIGEPVFTDLDMYLMGLLPPEQVGEHIVFADQNQARTLPCSGLFTGATIRVRVGDIITALGPRVPNSAAAPKRFKVATVIVSKDALLSEDEMAFYNFFSARAEETREVSYHSGFSKGLAKPFAISTGGRASLDARVAESIPVTYTIPVRGGFSITSPSNIASAAPEPAVGYGRVIRDPGSSAPSGLAIFGLRQNGVLVTEATVPASTPITSGRIYAEVGDGVNTGLAIANPNNQDVTITFYFTNQDGQRFGDGNTVIRAQNQIARFLDQSPFNGGASIQGTLTFNSSAPVAVIGLRGHFNERSEFLITTLEVADLSATADSSAVLFPHFADGNGWTTQFALVNSTDEIMNGRLEFYGPGTTLPSQSSGAPVQVTVDGQTSNSFSYSIPPRSSRRMRTSGIGTTTQSGSVRMTPDVGSRTPSALAIFGYRNNAVTVTEASVPALRMATVYRLYAETSGDFNSSAVGSVQTGLAIANPSSSPAVVNIEATSLAGVSTGLAGALTVPSNGQVPIFLGQIQGFERLPNPFRGVLRIVASSNVSVVGLRARYNERREFLVTTTQPSIESAAPPNADLFFPHFAVGGGYATQFVLYNGTADQTFSGVIRFFTGSGQRAKLTFQ